MTNNIDVYLCEALIPLPVWLQEMQRNGSLYIHVYFTKSGFHPDPKRKGQYRRLATVHATRSKSIWKRHTVNTRSSNRANALKYSVFKPVIFIFIFTLSVLNKFKRRKFQKTKNLLTGETEADPEMIKVSSLIFFMEYVVNEGTACNVAASCLDFSICHFCSDVLQFVCIIFICRILFLMHCIYLHQCLFDTDL